MRSANGNAVGIAILGLFGLGAVVPLPLRAQHVDPKLYLDDVTYLASPQLKGRATGSPELETAAAHIAGLFQTFGLKPVDGKNYELSFPAEIGAKLGSRNAFSFSDGGATHELKVNQDFEPISFSTVGKTSDSVVFAGYGITAKPYHYDDYENVDVTGKLVLILRHEPQENDRRSVFDGKKLTSYATFVDKMANAKAHGARGVILVNDVATHPGKEDKLEEFGSTRGPRDAGIFFVQVKEATAEEWFRAEGRDLHQTAAEIDNDLKPRSFELAKLKVDLEVDLTHETKTVHNVAGFLPGTTPEYIVIGAHYDHLGLGDEHSLAPDLKGTIHPGADDNASGTSGVIELARWFSHQPQPKRGVLFMTFAGEELGLLGSAWYVNHPSLPLGDAVAMINLDMIGRIRDGHVFMSGANTGTTLEQLVAGVKPPAPLNIDETGKNSGTNLSDASDHASFRSKSVPTLFFFSGLHADYHKPSDTADKINSNDAAKLLDYVAELTTRLADAPDRPQFVKVAPERAPVAGGGRSSGYGPDFGSIPDFDEPPTGVRFADVRQGSPAAKAGLQAGDILIEFDGKKIGNLYDFTYVLREHKPQDLVPVKVLRNGQTIEAKVLLTERR
jgi:Zn-dependent M28 family amino/carboxypeptidase